MGGGVRTSRGINLERNVSGLKLAEASFKFHTSGISSTSGEEEFFLKNLKSRSHQLLQTDYNVTLLN